MKLGEVARLVGIAPRRCWRKQQWRTEGAANAQLRSLLRKTLVVEADRLNSFVCPECGWWHVGHMPGGSHGRQGP